MGRPSLMRGLFTVYLVKYPCVSMIVFKNNHHCILLSNAWGTEDGV